MNPEGALPNPFSKRETPVPIPHEAEYELMDDDIEVIPDSDTRSNPSRGTEYIPQQEEEIMELAEDDLLETREPGELQEPDVVEAFEIKGFPGLEVVATLEAKNARKKDKEMGKQNRNQDNIIADPETGLLGVLDGLGGEGFGDLASKEAETSISKHFADELKNIMSLDTPRVVQRLANAELAYQGQKDFGNQLEIRKNSIDEIEKIMQEDPSIGKKGLALIEAIKATHVDVKKTKGKSTICVGTIHTTPDGSHWAIIANAGDSGAFLKKENGLIEALTKEDSLFRYLIKTGALTPELLDEMKNQEEDEKRADNEGTNKDAEERKTFPIEVLPGLTKEYTYTGLKIRLTQALGGSDPDPSLVFRSLNPGEEILFATDGVIDKFESQETDEMNLVEMASSSSLGGRSQINRLDTFREISKARTTYKEDDDIAIVSARVPKEVVTDVITKKKAA
ncbi:MAG: protein phosphatase 2C domain-containing protein [bacterium]|nr:protein phosphatase 2C domain-containing protein [bacterium]